MRKKTAPSDAPSKMPFGVVIAELFLVVILAIYFAKVGVLVMGLSQGDVSSDAAGEWWMFFYYLVEAALCLLTLSGLFALSSRKPSGWRQAVRSTATLLLMTLFGYLFDQPFSLTGLITVRLDVVLVLVVLVLIAMMSPSVRRWYIPSMMEPRPLSAWIVYAVHGELYPTKTAYRISYPEARDEAMDKKESATAGAFDVVESFVRRFL